MLVHYCGALGACNNNEAKNLPPPFSSHPLYPEFRGLAAVLRRCCSFFSSSPVPCVFLVPVPFAGSARARSAQAPSGATKPLGTRASSFPFFIFLIFSVHEAVLTEPRAEFAFQQIPLLFSVCKWWEGLFVPQGGGCEFALCWWGWGSRGGAHGDNSLCPPCPGWHREDMQLGVSPDPLAPHLGHGRFCCINQEHDPKAELLVPAPRESEGWGNVPGNPSGGLGNGPPATSGAHTASPSPTTTPGCA